MNLLDDLEKVRVFGHYSEHMQDVREALKRLKDFIEANKPWTPPQLPGFGPWIEYREGDQGPRVNEVVDILCGEERSTKKFTSTPSRAANKRWHWKGLGSDIVAYCVKLEDTL